MSVISGSDRSLIENLLMANTIGESVLIETMKLAAFYVQHSDRTSFNYKVRYQFFKEAESCFLHVQGSGLAVTLQEFGLDYDADALRNGFNYYMRRSV